MFNLQRISHSHGASAPAPAQALDGVSTSVCTNFFTGSVTAVHKGVLPTCDRVTGAIHGGSDAPADLECCLRFACDS